MIYFQPILTDAEWAATWLPSFGVFRKKTNARRAFPGREIARFSGQAIEDPTFVDLCVDANGQFRVPKTFVLEVLYRCASNFKTYFAVIVSEMYYPGVSDLKSGSEINMGQFGTPSEKNFFESNFHPYPFHPDDDHNILEVIKIYELDEAAM
jgi:hypothetical protein